MLYNRKGKPNLLEYANAKRRLQSFNDVTICAGTTSIPANKLVLSCYSRFFEKMFLSEMMEKNQHSVEIDVIDGKSMKNIVDYMYVGKIVLKIENAFDLLAAADFLQIDDLKKGCFLCLKASLKSDNALAIFKMADRYRNDSLKNEAAEFISEKFDQVSSSFDFIRLKRDELLTCISKLDFRKVSQASVYEALIKWSKHDVKNRSLHFTELFQHIKLDEIPLEFIENIIQKEELVTSNLVCVNLLLKAVLSARSKSSQPNEKRHGSRILKLGGCAKSERVMEIYRFYLEHYSQFYPDLPKFRAMGCSTRLNEHAYYINGCNINDIPTKTVWKIRLNERYLKWEEASSTNVGRSYTAVAILNGKLLVAGGLHVDENDENVRTPSVEYYSPAQNTWSVASPMLQARSSHALVSCKGSVYAIGGTGIKGESLSSVERLKDVTESWNRAAIKAMKTPRSGLAAVNCQDTIYAIGGSLGNNEEQALSSVERYDFGKNRWTDINSMRFPRWLCSAVVHEAKIYVIGGVNLDKKFVKEIECFDPLIKTWKKVGETDEMILTSSPVII